METCGKEAIFIFGPFWTKIHEGVGIPRRFCEMLSEVSGGVDDCGCVLEDLQLLEGCHWGIADAPDPQLPTLPKFLIFRPVKQHQTTS